MSALITFNSIGGLDGVGTGRHNYMDTQEEEVKFSIFTKAEGGAETVVEKKALNKIAINALVELLVAIMESKRK